MRRTLTGLTLAATLSAVSFPAEAQHTAKAPRIGFLSSGSPSSVTSNVAAFREGLQQLGNVEEKMLLLSIGMERGNSLDYLDSQTNSFARKST
jgi:hypothetical protein